MFISSCFNNY